ncbi:MAG: hypothetical protein KAX33_11225 [Candidatus Lokiarchaeota archaeon]|nr:hypothetical protein [Candidatus Lokiarchaeota archaeon]
MRKIKLKECSIKNIDWVNFCNFIIYGILLVLSVNYFADLIQRLSVGGVAFYGLLMFLLIKELVHIRITKEKTQLQKERNHGTS